MAIYKVAGWIKYRGPSSERDAFDPGGMDCIGVRYYCTDTKITYDWDGQAWIAPPGGGMASHGNEYHTSTFMIGNQAITGATKTKITYDAKGLVTSGANATADDISDGSTTHLITTAQQTILNNTSGTNSGDASGHSALAPIDDPNFTTKITTPAITLGATAITSTAAELNLLDGITVLSGSNTGDASGHSGLMPLSAFSGLAKITVGTTNPSNPDIGDLWIDTN